MTPQRSCSAGALVGMETLIGPSVRPVFLKISIWKSFAEPSSLAAAPVPSIQTRQGRQLSPPRRCRRLLPPHQIQISHGVTWAELRTQKVSPCVVALAPGRYPEKAWQARDAGTGITPMVLADVAP